MSMESTQITLDQWLEAVVAQNDVFTHLMNALLTSLDEIDKSLCSIANAIDSHE